ncbi:MAG: hypothetical protein ACRDAQ_08340 [Cetobacterium sp.]
MLLIVQLGHARFKTEKNEIIRDVVYLNFRKDTVVVCRQSENCFLRLNIPTDYSSENLIQYLLKEYCELPHPNRG